jgi:hypothetical protein
MLDGLVFTVSIVYSWQGAHQQPHMIGDMQVFLSGTGLQSFMCVLEDCRLLQLNCSEVT